MNNYDLKIESNRNCSKQIRSLWFIHGTNLICFTKRFMVDYYIYRALDGRGRHWIALGMLILFTRQQTTNHCTGIYLQFCQKHKAVEESSWCFHAMMVFFVLPRCKFSWTDSSTDQHTRSHILWFILFSFYDCVIFLELHPSPLASGSDHNLFKSAFKNIRIKPRWNRVRLNQYQSNLLVLRDH